MAETCGRDRCERFTAEGERYCSLHGGLSQADYLRILEATNRGEPVPEGFRQVVPPRRGGRDWNGVGWIAAVLLGVLVVALIVIGWVQDAREIGSALPTDTVSVIESDALTDSEYLQWWDTHRPTATGADWYWALEGYAIYSTYLEIHTSLQEDAEGAALAEPMCGFFSTIRYDHPSVDKVRISGAAGDYLATC